MQKKEEGGAHEWGNFFFSPFFILHASIPLITFVSRGHKSYNRHTQDIRRNERGGERENQRKVGERREREKEKERVERKVGEWEKERERLK